MNNLYPIDPLLAANLVCELHIREEHMLGEQMRYLARAFMQRIKGLTRGELAYITYIFLEAYSARQGKPYLVEFILELIEQQLKAY